MKRFCRMLVFPCLFLIVFSLIPGISNAQIGDPGEDPDAPIDGGVGILIAAGVGYGLKKARDRKQKNKTVQLDSESSNL